MGLITTAARGQGDDGGGQYEVYRCRHKPATELEKPLKDLLPAGSDVHLVVDPQSNSLLLRGGPEAQRIAEEVMEHMDRPADRPAPQASAEQGRAVVKAYQSPAGRLDHWLGIVRALCAPVDTARVTTARPSNRIMVLAPPQLHEQISQRLDREAAAVDAGPEKAGRPTPPSGRDYADMQQTGRLRSSERGPRRADSESTATILKKVDRMIHLRWMRAKELEQRLVALFGRRLRSVRDGEEELMILPVGPPDAERHRTLKFQVDTARQLVLVSGPEKVVAQFAQLVEALDAGKRAGQRTRAVHVERTSDDQLREAVEAYQGETPAAKKEPPPRNDQSSYNPPNNGVRLVNYLFQQESEAGGAESGGERDSAEPAVVPNIPGLSDLEVETLPDLDVIILRGRDQDVEQLTEIIRELERLSKETTPKIQIYHLKHTHGEAVNEIILEVQEQLIGRRQGRVTVTPLVKPNSLLLIGWGEAVDAMVELIDKLDRPVPPETEFAVFHLRHAAVATVDQTVTQFLSGREGLGPRVVTAVDARTNSLIVYAAPRDMKEVRRLIKEIDVPQSGAVNRARIFRLDNALATDVAQTLEQAITAAQTGQTGRSAVLELMVIDEEGKEVLQSGMLNEMTITPNPRNNTLIVTGPPQGMGLIEAFIEQLDSPGDRAQIKVFRIKNADATSLVSVLRSLIPSQVGQAPAGPQLPAAAAEEESLAPLRFSVEVRSNSIIAVGSEGDLRIVEALITRLDESESMNRKNAVYLLKNAPAVDIAQAVTEFLESRRTLQAAEPGQSNPFEDLAREAIVIPEPVSNRLIVSATPRYFEEITELIEKLDEPPPEVVIQALIAEVDLGDRDELGVELGIQDSILFDRSLLGDLLTTTQSQQQSTDSGVVSTTEEIIQAATNTPGYEFNSNKLGNSGSDKALAGSKQVGSQALANFAVGRQNEETGFGGLVLSASSRNISLLIRAMQEDRQLRILSRPVIRTMDNQPSFIQVGQRVPRIIGSTVGNFGQSNQISLENVGLILGVTPRISPDGRVAMEIDAEKSKVGPEEEGIPVGTSPEGTVIRSPRVDTITAQATVSVADGETVVLGGLISTEEESVERRAPYLADIPILGHLFRYDWSDDRRSEMLIILTPQVIENPADAESLKQAEFARMNWCAADVYDLYGDIGMDFKPNLSVPREGSETEVIYPDMNPRGQPSPPPHPDQTGKVPPQDASDPNPPQTIPPAAPPMPPPNGNGARQQPQPGPSSTYQSPRQWGPNPSNLPLPPEKKSAGPLRPNTRPPYSRADGRGAPAAYAPNREAQYQPRP